MKKIYIETMGCQMNKSESERIIGMLSHFGYEECENPREADLLIVNTCSIRQLSANKAYSQIGVWGKWKRHRNIKIGFCGCVAQQDGEKLDAILSEIKNIVDKKVMDKIKKKVKSIFDFFISDFDGENYSNDDVLSVFKARELRKHLKKILKVEKKRDDDVNRRIESEAVSKHI